MDNFGKVISPILDNVVEPVVQLAFVVALVVFVYGVLKMVFNKTDADAHSDGKKSILWGLVGMVIMTSAWGIIYLISDTVKEFGK